MSFNLVCTLKILTKMTLYQHNRNITTKGKNGSFPYAFMSMFTLRYKLLCRHLNMRSFWGFAKSRPAAQRPDPQRLSGPAARRPRFPRPAARGPRTATRPSPDFPQHFCPAVKQRACTDLQRVWVNKMDLSLNSFTILIIISIVLSVSFMLLR